MAFLRVKHIKGGDYLYLVENHRNGDKVYQDIIEYRGRVGGNSKARVPYNTLRRWQASVDAFGKPKSAISTTKMPFSEGNAPSPTSGESAISTTKGAILGGNGTFIKSAKQTTGKN